MPRTTRIRTITILAPVPEGSLAQLSQRLRLLSGRPSPFAAVPSTHFARLAVLARGNFHPQPRPQGMRWPARLLDVIAHAGRAQRPDPPSRSYLLFSASYDGVPRADNAEGQAEYVEQLRLRLREMADQVWGLCSEYPGWSDQVAFRDFFAARSLPARYVFPASDEEPTVGRIKNALQLRQQVIDLAVDAADLGDDELVRRLRKTFSTSLGDPAGVGRSEGDDGLDFRPSPGERPDVGRFAPGTVPGTGVLLPEPPTDPSEIDREPPTEPDLADVQNLVTSGYPRHHVSRHLLLQVTDPAAARHWLAAVADEIPTAQWADGYLDRLDFRPIEGSAAAQSEGRVGAPGFALHVALSYAGLARLDLPEDELAGFPTEFRVGMAERELGLVPGRGTSTWRAPFAANGESAVHVLVLFSATDQADLDDHLEDRPWLVPNETNGLRLLRCFEGGRIREDRYGQFASTGKPGFLEHFGFVDGLSQPRVHGVTVGRRVAELPAGEALLGYRDVDGDIAGASLPVDLAKNGSYLVYRRLEQDVPAFRDLTRRLAGQLADAAPTEPGTDLQELAAAKLIGRWRDGTPLTLSPTGGHAALAREPFGYQADDAAGFGCPVGAHIRRVNPRDSRPVEPNPSAMVGTDPGLEARLALRHRMLRRGIPYGAPLPVAAEDDPAGLDQAQIAATQPEQADADQAEQRAEPGEERGLLFVALVGDIRRQFEFVQANWMSDGNAFRLGTDLDVLSGAAPEGTKITVQGTPPTFVRPSQPLVTCRGGEYFFLPGIAALKRIAEA
jgi:Dyp-type peroxidase family